MVCFAIIELDDGFSVTAVPPGQTPEDAAKVEHGVLVDAGPYATYEDAYDALCELEDEDEEQRD